MTNIKIKVSQFSDRANKIIGFDSEDSSDPSPSVLQMKWWATILLHHWYLKYEHLGVKTFNKRKPIKIEAFIENELVGTFTQKRVTKDTMIKENRDVQFPFLKTMYVLTNYDRPISTTKDSKTQTTGPTNFKNEKYFNTIEHFQNDRPSFATPIIYTGWKD